jgi:hypothetical protein
MIRQHADFGGPELAVLQCEVERYFWDRSCFWNPVLFWSLRRIGAQLSKKIRPKRRMRMTYPAAVAPALREFLDRNDRWPYEVRL